MNEVIDITNDVLSYIRKNWDLTVRKNENSTEVEGEVKLPYPFSVPTIVPKFRLFFYWDTYFTGKGLIGQGRIDIALNNANNFIYLCEEFGYIPNYNQYGHLTRSQLPFAAMAYRDVFAATKDLEWLKKAYNALQIEYSYWMGMRIGPHGLNRHYTHATPTELMAFFEGTIERMPFAIPKDRSEILRLSMNSMAECENWDFTPRYENRCTEFYPVDLNGIMYSLEMIAADFAGLLELPEDLIKWMERACERQKLMTQFLWNEEKGMFFDYDFINNVQAKWETASNYFALAGGLPTQEQAAHMHKSLEVLEFDHGISTGAIQGRDQFVYQWDYPNAWPPIQTLAIEGMIRYGYDADARRFAKKYIETVNRNFATTGLLWEKYNAVSGNIDVVDEYEMPSFLDWTAGAYIHACQILGLVDCSTFDA